jgi:hypothetical protein
MTVAKKNKSRRIKEKVPTEPIEPEQNSNNKTTITFQRQTPRPPSGTPTHSPFTTIQHSPPFTTIQTPLPVRIFASWCTFTKQTFHSLPIGFPHFAAAAVAAVAAVVATGRGLFQFTQHSAGEYHSFGVWLAVVQLLRQLNGVIQQRHRTGSIGQRTRH